MTRCDGHDNGDSGDDAVDDENEHDVYFDSLIEDEP